MQHVPFMRFCILKGIIQNSNSLQLKIEMCVHVATWVKNWTVLLRRAGTPSFNHVQELHLLPYMYSIARII